MEDQLIKALEDSVNDFVRGLQEDEKQIFNNLLNLIKELELKGGSIKRSVKNLRLIKQIQQEVDKVVFTNKYYKKVSDFTDMYEDIADIQNLYYATLVEDFTVSKTVLEIKKQAVEWTTQELRQNFPRTVSNQIGDIIRTNIKDGASYASLSEQLRHNLITTKGNPGIYTKYAETYAIDAVNGYTAMYADQMAADLGLEWGKYVGSLIKTSRTFCRKLIEAKSLGHPYVHRSQIPDLLKGNIFGVQIAVNPKTGLPYGLKDGTNKDNFVLRRGGWRCGHQFIWVSSAVVPKELKLKVLKK